MEEELKPWRQRALLETAVNETCVGYLADKEDALDVSVQSFIASKWVNSIRFPCWLRRGKLPGSYSYNTLDFTITEVGNRLMVGKESIRDYLLDNLPEEYESKPHPMAVRLAVLLRYDEQSIKEHFDLMLLADDSEFEPAFYLHAVQCHNSYFVLMSTRSRSRPRTVPSVGRECARNKL
jgi:hypothetical protein